MVVRVSQPQARSWRLAKHYLSDRAPKSQLARVVSDVCGIQAQVMSGAEMAIWARVADITATDVQDALWKERRLVKTWCMRGTLHLLAADDLPVYVAALKTRTLYRSGSWLKFHKITLDEIDMITSEARNALDGRCLTREQLVDGIMKRAGLRSWVRREMSSGWGSLLHPAAYKGNLCFGPNEGRNVTFVRPDQWLGKWDDPDSEEAFRRLLLRFVEAYGPSSSGDLGHWWGQLESEAKRIFRAVTDQLEEVDFEGRRAWFSSEDVERVKQSTRAKSVRLVPGFDPYIMFYSPRELLVESRFRSKVFRQLAGWVSPVLLIDGIAAGVWQCRKLPGETKVSVEQFRPLTSRERGLVEEEAADLGRFLGTKSSVSISK